MYANETLAITAGGLSLKVWDLLGGGRLLASLSNHHKSILCTGFTSEQHYILSGGLDRHVKVYDASTFRVVHTISYPDAVLSLAMVGPNDRALCVGMPGGLWSVKRRDGKQQLASSSPAMPMNNSYEAMKNEANGDAISSGNALVPMDDESTNDTKSTASSGSRKTKSRRRFLPSGKNRNRRNCFDRYLSRCRHSDTNSHRSCCCCQSSSSSGTVRQLPTEIPRICSVGRCVYLRIETSTARHRSCSVQGVVPSSNAEAGVSRSRRFVSPENSAFPAETYCSYNVHAGVDRSGTLNIASLRLFLVVAGG